MAGVEFPSVGVKRGGDPSGTGYLRLTSDGGRVSRVRTLFSLRAEVGARLLAVLTSPAFLKGVYSRAVEPHFGSGVMTGRMIVTGYLLSYQRADAQDVLTAIKQADPGIGANPEEEDFIRDQIIARILHGKFTGAAMFLPCEGGQQDEAGTREDISEKLLAGNPEDHIAFYFQMPAGPASPSLFDQLKDLLAIN